MCCARIEYDASYNDEDLILEQRHSNQDLAKKFGKFAPMIYFDQNSQQFPMALSHCLSISRTANGKRAFSNYNPSWESFDKGKMGLSYTVTHCTEWTKIPCQIFYKGQQPCFLTFGSHEGDRERLTVELTSDF